MVSSIWIPGLAPLAKAFAELDKNAEDLVFSDGQQNSAKANL